MEISCIAVVKDKSLLYKLELTGDKVGNQIIMAIVKKVDRSASRYIFRMNEEIFSVYHESRTSYICRSKCESPQIFKILENTHDYFRLLSDHRESERNITEFITQLIREETKDGSKASQLKSDVSQLHQILVGTVQKLTERGENIKSLNERSEMLQNNAVDFKRSANVIESRERRKLRCSNLRFIIIALVVVGVIVLVVVVVFAVRKK